LVALFEAAKKSALVNCSRQIRLPANLEHYLFLDSKISGLKKIKQTMMKSLAVSCPRVLQLANRYSGYRGSNGVFRGICAANGGVGFGSPQDMAPVGRFYFSKKNKSTKRNKSVLDFGGLTPRDASGLADVGLDEVAGDKVLRENENQLNKLGTIHVTQSSTKSEERGA
jgi:hypothetical protein